jgi:hypothetical protein
MLKHVCVVCSSPLHGLHPRRFLSRMAADVVLPTASAWCSERRDPRAELVQADVHAERRALAGARVGEPELTHLTSRSAPGCPSRRRRPCSSCRTSGRPQAGCPPSCSSAGGQRGHRAILGAMLGAVTSSHRRADAVSVMVTCCGTARAGTGLIVVEMHIAARFCLCAP